jgi:hypothetical protein
MVDRPARQIAQLYARIGDPSLAGDVRIADHRIGVGHIQIVTDQHHAKRRVQMIDEHGFLVRYAVAMRVTKQQNALPRLRTGVRHLLDPVHDQFLRAADWTRRTPGLDHQDIAIR